LNKIVPQIHEAIVGNISLLLVDGSSWYFSTIIEAGKFLNTCINGFSVHHTKQTVTIHQVNVKENQYYPFGIVTYTFKLLYRATLSEMAVLFAYLWVG